MRSAAARSASRPNFHRSRAAYLLALLGLDRAIAAADGPAQFEGSVNRRMACAAAAQGAALGRGPRCRCRWLGRAVGCRKQGKRQSEGSQRRHLAVARPQVLRRAAGRIFRLSSRVALSGSRLSFEDVDSIIARRCLRGRVALTLGEEKNYLGRGRARSDPPLRRSLPQAIGAAGP